MVSVLDSIGIAAPYYNIAMVVVVLILFSRMFYLAHEKKISVGPWKFLFYAILIYIVEEVMTILGKVELLSFPHFIFGLFEMTMISLFIYMCLVQKDLNEGDALLSSKKGGPK